MLEWSGGPKGRRFAVRPVAPSGVSHGIRNMSRPPDTVQNTQPPKIYLDIDAAMKRGEMQRAIALARQALDAGMSHPVLLNLRAYEHESEGRYREACADLETARKLTPRDSVILNALGRCLAGGGRYYDSLVACEAALAEDPRLAVAHYNLGFAHEQLGELDAASTCYGRALQLAPDMADAMARLAGLASRRGRHAEARALADRALAQNPQHAIALFAHIVSDLSEKKFDDAERRSRSVIAEPATTAQARANAQCFLGDALDGQGRFAEAFVCYRQANEGLRLLFKEQYEDSGRETGRPRAERLAREFADITKDAWRSTQPVVSDSDAAGLAFVVGFPRAGTTLLGQILASHSQVVTVEEKPLLGAALQEFINTPGGLGRLAKLTADEIARHRTMFWKNAAGLGLSLKDKYLIDQTPLNSLHLPVVAKLFPEAKIIFALRDPRDVVLSCFRRLFVVNDYVYEFHSLEGTAAFYDRT